MSRKLTIGLTLSLSGRYAAMGRQAAAALQLFAADRNAAGGMIVGGQRHEVEIRCLDDAGDARQCAAGYRSLCFENPADIVFGPYSSGLVRVAAPIAEAATKVIVNHGGAADDLYRTRPTLLVSVATPASEYFAGFAQLISQLKLWRKRVAAVCSPTPFGRSVAAGLKQRCAERSIYRRGVRFRIRHEAANLRGQPLIDFLLHLVRARINVVACAGDFAQDVALVDAVVRSNLNIPVLACVAAGVSQFRAALGETAEGIVGPSQWEEGLRIEPEIGPTPAEFARAMRAGGAECDYPAAQIYAAGLVTAAALRACDDLDQAHLRRALADLHLRTLFGDFAIDPASGRQIAHQMILVQWHGGQKVIIHPDAHADSGALEIPSGWQLLLASLANLRIRRPPADDDSADDRSDNDDDDNRD